MLEAIVSGRWLTKSRRRGYSIISLVLVVATLGWLAFTSHGGIAYDGKPLGTDFSNVYAAGRMALRGEAPLAYDWDAEFKEEQAVFGREDIPFFGWHYPPYFLILAAALALLPYIPALVIWQLSTFSIYLALARKIVDQRETLLLAAAAPVVFVNFSHGHNGFLTASLLAGALLVLDRRPILAGILIGLMIYKPQFGTLIPFVLALTGRWRTFASAAITVLLLTAIVTALFGFDVWIAFQNSMELTRTIVLEAGSTGWEKIQSFFSAVRMWGGSINLAYVAQGTLSASVAFLTVWLWRKPVSLDVKASALCSATLLMTPYVLDYDMVLLCPAIAFMARDGIKTGFRPYEITLMAAAWMVPLIARPVAGTTYVPIGLLVTVLLFLVTANRGRHVAQNPARQPG